MSKPETVHIERHMTEEELDRHIKTEEKDVRVLKRLFFVRHRYDGRTVQQAAELVGTTKRSGYDRQERWNDDGYDGLIPRFANGKTCKLSDEQKDDLKEILGSGSYPLKEIHGTILQRYGVDHCMNRVRIIVKDLGMKCAKPYRHDRRRQADAEKELKKSSVVRTAAW